MITNYTRVSLWKRENIWEIKIWSRQLTVTSAHAVEEGKEEVQGVSWQIPKIIMIKAELIKLLIMGDDTNTMVRN